MNNSNSIIHINESKIDNFASLQNHMFSLKNLLKFTKYQENNTNNINTNKTNVNKINANNTNSNKTNTNKIKRDNFNPFQKDKLFWCFYVIKFGIDKFDMLGNQHFITEKEMKFKYIELLRSNKALLKAHKIKPLYELEDDLANKDKIGLKTFLAICLVDKINIIIIHKKKVFECLNDDINPIFFVTKKDENNYILDLQETNISDKLVHLRTNYFNWEHIDSSLKAITSYKLEELTTIAKKLDIDLNNNNSNSKKKTKKDIYELIIQNF
jgi:hypothetical protein